MKDISDCTLEGIFQSLMILSFNFPGRFPVRKILCHTYSNLIFRNVHLSRQNSTRYVLKISHIYAQIQNKKLGYLRFLHGQIVRVQDVHKGQEYLQFIIPKYSFVRRYKYTHPALFIQDASTISLFRYQSVLKLIKLDIKQIHPYQVIF